MESKEGINTETINFSLQQQVLLRGMIEKKENASIDYSKDENGIKKINLGDHEISASEAGETFRQDPRECLVFMRNNIININKDPQLTNEQRKNRIRRYTDAYLDLIVKLDNKAFPPNPNNIYSGVPDYIPDGLSDMGSDPNINPNDRDREKIRVDKEKMFNQSKELFYELFGLDYDPKKVSDKEIKEYFVKRISYFINTKIQYDHKDLGIVKLNRSVGLDEYMNRKMGVCRHHAMYTEVLLEAFGFKSKLMKSRMDGGPHANNLVRIENKWNLLDTTNPDQNGQVYMKEIPENNIDLNQNRYLWQLGEDQYRRKYESRNNMYYRIMDNKKGF